MATKKELQSIQKVQALEQEQLVGYWCKTLGITKKALDTHPCIDDIILLKHFRKEFPEMPSFWYKQYNKIYKSVYTGEIPLKGKQLKQLEKIAKGMIKWRRKRKTAENPGCNMTANDPGLSNF